MYSIGQVEKLTGVKAHILRYWEEQVPAFAPKKDFSGRRVYSQRDVEIILRLKHLIYERKFTIEGARTQIIRETGSRTMNSTAVTNLRQIRSELSQLYLELKQRK